MLTKLNKAAENDININPRDGYFDSTKPHTLALVLLKDKNLLFYYVTDPFALGAALLDKQDPKKILWRKEHAIWESSENIKPIKVIRSKDLITFYFNIRKKTQRLQFSLNDILEISEKTTRSIVKRAPNNPIIEARSNIPWESQYVFNPAAINLDDKIHFIYRAIGESGLSVLGHAVSFDGIKVDERSSEPAYICSGSARCKRGDVAFSSYAYSSGGSWSGCEDPRIIKIDDTIYMTYTAFSGWDTLPGVALTSISVNNFLAKRWDWQPPVLISPSHEIHKNWVIFPEKINGKFAILHSISPNVLIDYFDNLNFKEDYVIKSYYHAAGRNGHWDNWVRGVGPPPIKIKEGWLLLYHAMDKNDPNKYKMGAMILDEADPTKILYRANAPLLEPQTRYENEGFKAGVIYACGAIVKEEELFIYYGGADTVVCAATANLALLLKQIKLSQSPSVRKKTLTRGVI